MTSEQRELKRRPRARAEAVSYRPNAGLSRAQLSVGIVLAKNFTLSSFALFTDLLRLAADEGDRSQQVKVSWTVMSSGREPIRASCGVKVEPTSPLLDPKQFDYVVIVGGILH